MFETSRDLLNIVIALSIFLMSFAIAWFILEMTLIVRRMRKLVDDIQERLQKVNDAVESMTEKLGSTAASLGLMAEGAKQIIKYLIDKKMEHGKNRK